MQVGDDIDEALDAVRRHGGELVPLHRPAQIRQAGGQVGLDLGVAFATDRTLHEDGVELPLE